VKPSRRAQAQGRGLPCAAARSSYQTSHTNQFGQYQLHSSRETGALLFARKPPKGEPGAVVSAHLVAEDGSLNPA
jgi:hypothetical protein